MKFDRLMEQLTGVLALVVLVGGALIVVAPFVTALLWGAILAFSTYRPYLRLAGALGGRRAIAAVLIMLAILVLLIGPVVYAGTAFATRVPELVLAVQARLGSGMPTLPNWVIQLPLVGPRLEDAWEAVATRNPEVLVRIRQLAAPFFGAVLGAALSVVQGIGLLILSVLFAAFFYLSGESLGGALQGAMRRIAGTQAPVLLALIGGTVKGVVYGILGTSLAQAVLCAVGYWIAGLPSPVLLGLLTFFLAVIPGGPLLVIIPGAIWLVQQGAGGWAVFLVVWTLAVGLSIDNVLKPIIIGRSSHVPFILIMLGVLGGAAAFGLLGVFVGPTLLAVAHAVLRDWVSVKSGMPSAAMPGPAPPSTVAGGTPQRPGADPGPALRIQPPPDAGSSPGRKTTPPG
ncbi:MULTISPECIES: AI-2E family transporter [unclassified Massilia]|uniref:AI-2E family transporter n=1 Tax=unclassified Massilia TaxID=2609279 RepID=UPI000A9F23ED|nr:MULTISPECIES: AI-2E family transporter [unclassified Massilia]